MEVEILNPEPTYVKFIDIITPNLADSLVKLVIEKGILSKYNGNTNCKEYKLPNIFTGNLSKEEIILLSKLHSIVERIKEIGNYVFKDSALETIITHAGFWIMEYSEGGSFDEHVDYSLDDDEYSTPALATLVINLNSGDKYKGGELFISNKLVPSYYNGGYLWDGWTHHKVNPITEGKRYVLVVHFTGLMKK